jgi:hypothetical protein
MGLHGKAIVTQCFVITLKIRFSQLIDFLLQPEEF